MAIAIKRSDDAPGITADKEYPVLGYSGGGVVILDDDRKFQTLGYDRLSDWEVVTDEDKKSSRSPDKASQVQTKDPE